MAPRRALRAIWSDGDVLVLVGPAQTVLMRAAGEAEAAPLTGVPAGDYEAVWGFAPNDIWAGTAGGQLVHYDGSHWRLERTPRCLGARAPRAFASCVVEAKYVEYLELIQAAIRALEQEPQCGGKREDIHPDAWTCHIARPGQKARHMLLYRVRGERVEVGRFLYDGMDLPQHWPEPWEDESEWTRRRSCRTSPRR